MPCFAMTNSLCAMRDFLLMTLSFSALHTGFNVLVSGADPCPYERWYSFAGIVLVFGASSSSLATYAAGWPSCYRVAWSVDALGLLPGIFWQITTKPDGWFAAVPVAGCSVSETPTALLYWILGEWLTFGVVLRACLLFGFGVRPTNTLLILAGAALLAALTSVAARGLREVY